MDDKSRFKNPIKYNRRREEKKKRNDRRGAPGGKIQPEQTWLFFFLPHRRKKVGNMKTERERAGRGDGGIKERSNTLNHYTIFGGCFHRQFRWIAESKRRKDKHIWKTATRERKAPESIQCNENDKGIENLRDENGEEKPLSGTGIFSGMEAKARFTQNTC